MPLTAGVEIQALAMALRAALESLARQRDKRLALLQAQVALASSLELQSVLQMVLDQAARLTGIAGVRLFLRDARSREFRCWGTLGVDPSRAAAACGVVDEFVEQVAATRLARAMAVTDQGLRPILIEPTLEQPALVRLGWPLCAHGEPEAVLVFDTPTPRTYPSEDLAIVAGFANHAGLAIRHAALYRGEQDGRRQLDVLRETTTALFTGLEVQPLLERILADATTLIQVEAAGLYLWDAEAHAFILRVSCGQGPWCTTPRLAAMPPARDRSPLASAALGDPLAWPDVVVEPLIVNDRLLGLIGVNAAARPPLTVQEHVLLTLFTASAALAVTNAQLFERVQTGHATLAELSRRLVAVQEAERGHLARELHDEIGQVLTGLKFGVEAALGLSADAATPHLTRALRLLDDLIGQVRALSIALRPPMLDDFGVMPALQWLSARVANQAGVHVSVRSVGVEGRRFGLDVETAIFRVVQEGLTNVARHAGVPEARVALVAGRETIKVRIVDQGVGFDPAPPVAAKVSCGLAGMRQRVSLLGGTVCVQAQAGRGTRVTAEIPIPKMETQEPSLV
jgi:signal transduction histidine kinase